MTLHDSLMNVQANIIKEKCKSDSTVSNTDQDTHGLFNNTLRTSTQVTLDSDYLNYDETILSKPKSPLLGSPKPINKIDSELIRKPIECAKYAVWHKTEHYYVPLPCKKWSCPVCGKKNQKILHKRLSNSEAAKWSIKRHVILTVAEDAINSNLSVLLNDFITDMRRNGFPHLKYIWVKEFQYERFLKSGIWWRHIHMVVNVPVSKYDIIPYWNKHNKNKFNMVEVRDIRNFQSGSYLTKYFTKEEYQEIFDKGERRYGSSKNVLPPILKLPSSGNWEFCRLSTAQLVLMWFESSNAADRADIARSLGYDSRFDCETVRKIAYGIDF